LVGSDCFKLSDGSSCVLENVTTKTVAVVA
jgi:hypothetical protein